MAAVSSVSGVVTVAAVAFAGDRGILKVEISTDGGATWKRDRLKDPLSPYTWILWTTQVNLNSNKGNHKLTARSTDKTRNIQTAELADPFPNGAMGYHVINV